MYLHLYKSNPTAGAANGSEVSEEISSTLTVAAVIGATTITVANSANFHGAYGTRSALSITIGTETKTIASVNYETNVITLSAALTSAHAIGETVINSNHGSNPVSTTLSTTSNEVSSAIALALRCETGYNTSGNTTITPVGTSASKWQLSLDGITWLDWGASLIIASVIGVVNTLFYARAKAATGEIPTNDISVNLQISSNVVAV